MIAQLLVALLVVPANPPVITTCAAPPYAVAHRGGDEMAGENTLLAFRTAAEQAGVRTWETDVRFDAVGTPVILHDATVDRTTPATGEIADLQASGTVRIATDDGQLLPTLWEVLNLAKDKSARVLLELKVMPANAAQWAALFNRIDITIGRDQVTMISFDKAILDAVHERDVSIRTGLLDNWGDPGTATILAYGQSFVKYAPAYTKARVASWRAAGLELFAWTVDSPADWPRLVNYPVDGMITDKPLAYAGWLKTVCGTGVS